jgi:proteasome lid subunit RPN8/RPN11
MPALDEIRLAVQDGFQRLSRGGVEVGGLLFGSRQGRTIRILAQQPIACEHARGPAFLLSPQDEAALRAQIERAKTDPSLAGMSCVGWYVSHTRSGIALTDADEQVFRTHFGSPWQITLVLRPGRHGGVRGGFFVWEADGTVQVDRSYEEFNLPMPMATMPPPAPAMQIAPKPPFESPADPPPTAPVPVSARTDLARAQRFEPPRLILDEVQPKSRWPWVLLIAMLATGSFAGWRWWETANGPDPLALQVFERDGQLQIEWDRQSAVLRTARGAKLTIIDGSERRELPLSQADLVKGNVTYERSAEDVEVRLRVEGPNRSSREEASRFLGRAVERQSPQELEALRTQRDSLQSELKRMQVDNDRQANRIRQLEEAMRILENRLRVSGR